MEKKYKNINTKKLFFIIFCTIFLSVFCAEKFLFSISQSILASIVFFLIIMILYARLANMAWRSFNNNKYIYICILSLTTIIMCKNIFLIYNYKNTVIKIEATGDKNDLSNSSEVWITGIEANGVPVDMGAIELDGNWRLQEQYIVSTTGGSFEIPVDNMQSFRLNFQKHAWSGILKVTNNGITQKIDLFSPEYEEMEVFIDGEKQLGLLDLYYFVGSFCIISLIIAQFICLINSGKCASKLLFLFMLNVVAYWMINSNSLIFHIYLPSEIYILLHILLCLGIYKYIKIEFRIKIINIVFGGLFGISQLVRTLFNWSDSTVANIDEEVLIYYWGVCLFWIVIFSLFFNFICAIQRKLEFVNHSGILKKHYIMVLIGLGYFIYWLTYFPGILTPDSMNVLGQALHEAPLSNYQPIIYTLIESPFVLAGKAMGNIRMGIAAFSLCQMIFFVYCISTVIVWLSSKGLPNWLCKGLIIYSCLNPLLGMYSITLWKDIVFSLIIVLLTIELFDIIISKGQKILSRKNNIKFLILLCAMILFRNNGMLCAVFVLFGFAICKLSNKKRYLTTVLVSIIACIIIKGPIYGIFNIATPNFAESMSIPLQQIGYVVKNDGIIDAADYEFLNQMLPIDRIKDDFTYASVDRLKFDEYFDNDFLNENKTQFLKVWFRLVKNNFRDCIKAYLISIQGFYIVDSLATPWYEHSTYESVNPYACNMINLVFGVNSQIIIENIMTYVLDSLLLQLLIHPGFLCWTCAICIVLSLIKKSNLFVAFLPALGVWVSLMLGAPLSCDFRYVYPLFLLMPIFICFLCYNFSSTLQSN